MSNGAFIVKYYSVQMERMAQETFHFDSNEEKLKILRMAYDFAELVKRGSGKDYKIFVQEYGEYDDIGYAESPITLVDNDLIKKAKLLPPSRYAKS